MERERTSPKGGTGQVFDRRRLSILAERSGGVGGGGTEKESPSRGKTAKSGKKRDWEGFVLS